MTESATLLEGQRAKSGPSNVKEVLAWPVPSSPLSLFFAPPLR